MARRCVTVPGPSACCVAYSPVSQGGRGLQVGQPFPSPNGKHCMHCNIIQRTKNRGPGWQVRFVRNVNCPTLPGKCAALTGGVTAVPFQLPQGITLQ